MVIKNKVRDLLTLNNKSCGELLLKYKKRGRCRGMNNFYFHTKLYHMFV